MRSSHTAENHQAGGKSVESDRDRRQEKENIFGAMCGRSKTWQSHDQRHLIILELHCSFNPSERTIFYRGVWGGGGAVKQCQGGERSQRKAVTSCWKCILLNAAWHFSRDSVKDDDIKPPCVWGMEDELVGLRTQMCHKSLSTHHWIVLLFFSWGLGKLPCWMWPDYYILHLAHRDRVRVTQRFGLIIFLKGQFTTKSNTNVYCVWPVVLFIHLDCLGYQAIDVCLLLNMMELEGTWLVVFKAQKTNDIWKLNSNVFFQTSKNREIVLLKGYIIYMFLHM